MKSNEIKNLFSKTDEQLCIDEVKKKETYDAMLDELEKRRRPVMSVKNTLRYQFWYIDKLFFILYGLLICFGMIALGILQHIGMEQTEMISVCMVWAGILSIISISAIDKMFFGKIGELGKSCYFGTKQCVAVWLLLSGLINIAVLFLMAGYLNYHWKVELLQVGVYILTPYLIADIIFLGILSTETKGAKTASFGMGAIFVSVSYLVVGQAPGILLATSLSWWIAVFLVAGFLLIMQVKRLFSKIESGEVLCTN